VGGRFEGVEGVEGLQFTVSSARRVNWARLIRYVKKLRLIDLLQDLQHAFNIGGVIAED
jgi:hypothetical protein